MLSAFALVGLLCVPPPLANAEPSPSEPSPSVPAPSAPAPSVPAPPVSDGSNITLTDMGKPNPLAFYGDQGNAELTFPVPRGMVPAALKATVEVPVNVRTGVIAVTQKDRTIARVPLPTSDLAPITIPLAGVAVEDNAVTVTLRTSLVPEQGYCLEPTTPLRLTDGVVSFGGTEIAPTTVDRKSVV